MKRVTRFKKPYVDRIIANSEPIYRLLALGAGKLRAERKLARHILAVDWVINEEAQNNAISIKCDIREICKMIPDNSFDAVTLFDVIEHISKDDGMKLLKDLEKKARQILLFVPIEKKSNSYLMKQSIMQGIRKEENKVLGHHLSCWTPEEFHKMGYYVEVSPEYHKEKGIGAMICVKINKEL